MEILIKHYHSSRERPSRLIELIFEDNGNQLRVDVTNLRGLVDVGLIENLRGIADQLEEQNKMVERLTIEKQ